MAKLETFQAAKDTVMVITNVIVKSGRRPVASTSIVIPANLPIAMIQSSFSTRLTVSGLLELAGA